MRLTFILKDLSGSKDSTNPPSNMALPKFRRVRPIQLIGISAYLDMVSWKTPVLYWCAVFWWKHIKFHYPCKLGMQTQENELFTNPSSLHLTSGMRIPYEGSMVRYESPTQILLLHITQVKLIEVMSIH